MGAMILGLGMDVVEVARIAASLEKLGDAFLAKVLLPDEIAYCRTHREPARQVDRPRRRGRGVTWWAHRHGFTR